MTERERRPICESVCKVHCQWHCRRRQITVLLLRDNNKQQNELKNQLRHPSERVNKRDFFLG